MVKKKKIIAVVQARLGSKRFPHKILKKIGNKTIIEIINSRLKKSKYLDGIIYAIPSNNENKKLFDHLESLNTKIFKGSENNVLDRVYKSARYLKADIILRITSDCPLVDPNMIDMMIKNFSKEKIDYITNTRNFFSDQKVNFYPDGFDIEIFTTKSLKISRNLAKSEFDKQHVTSFIRQSKKFKKKFIICKNNYENIKLSIDEYKNLNDVKKIFKFFQPDIYFSFDKIIKKKILEKYFKNRIEKNKIKNGLKLWSRAKKIIPGGNMLLSKNPDRYLPNGWPTYFKSAYGCTIVDLDNNKYLDLSTMGVGTNTLGYGNNKVDHAVKRAVNLGNMSTLNCAEEVELADKLLKLHPWFKMAKFARTGGEANSIAIRIARTATKKDNVAICGYHGWHDWYLSTNLNNSKKNNLNNHLMKNLNIGGVPKKLKNTSFSFNYGDFNSLKKIVKTKNIGTIKMEVCRNTQPDINFLRKVRNLATKNNIILIFDECTTGFRETYGGLHKKINIKPDIVIFGKALGNGYAITAILGKEKVMQSANRTFISSTFWSERIGSVAALKTLQVMKEKKSWQYIHLVGSKIKKNWQKLFNKYKLKVSIRGINSLLNFVFESKNHQAYKTLITQEMIKDNILATTAIYPCIKHSDSILKKYYKSLEKVLKIISMCENQGHDVRKFIKSPVSNKDFYRYN